MDEDDGEDADESSSYELKARMSEGSLRVKVSLEVEEEGSKVEIEVSGGEPGASLDVTIGGSLVGTIGLNAEGEGHAEFSNRGDDDDSNESPLPDGFVPPVEGDAVTVGPLSGTLTLDDDSQSGDDSDDDDASGDESDDDSHDGTHEDQDEHEDEDDD